MFDYLQQFNKLDKDLRNKISSPAIMAVLSSLETKYRIDLAMIVIRVMVKKISLNDLDKYFVSEYLLKEEESKKLSAEMREKVFNVVIDYLRPRQENKEIKQNTSTDNIIKETGIMLPSEELVLRFKNIINTYTKGVRNKIDTRSTLAKEISNGGLNLKNEEIDDIFKVCDKKTIKDLDSNLRVPPVVSRLDKIINQADGRNKSGEYNLKKAIENKEIKLPKKEGSELIEKKETGKIDISHEIESPKIKNAKRLESPKKRIAIATVEVKEKNEESVKIQTSILEEEDKKEIEINKNTPEVFVKDPSIYKIEKPSKKTHAISTFFKGKKVEKGEVKPEKQKQVVEKEEIKRQNQVVMEGLKEENIRKESKAEKRVAVKKEEMKPSIVRPVTETSSQKPKVHDIKSIPKVMSPIEELQFLDLVNFHRLGETPEKIVSKILSKIKLLEGSGYEKMIQGIKAWRQSPVNHLYLKIGQEAIRKGVSMGEAAEEREKTGKDYLTINEIQAIINLNSKLIF